MVCDGRRVGDSLMQPTWVEDFLDTAAAHAFSDQRAFLNLYQDFQKFPLSKELKQKARGIINTLLRQVTDKISRRDLTTAEKQKLNVRNGCCITVGAAAHFDSDAADRLSLGNAENSAESTSEPASKKQRKSAKKPSKVVSEMDSDSDATAKWITDDPRYSANRQIEVLHPIADGFQWFLGKITSCRRQSDRVQLSVSWVK